MTASATPAAAPTPPRRSRTGRAVFAGAAVVGLWLGLTAPSTSPVTPQPPPTVASAPAAAPVALAAPGVP